LKKLIVIIVLTAFFTGCTDSSENQLKSVEEIGINEIITHLKVNGFNTDGYLLEGDNIIVEGDIRFNFNELKRDITDGYSRRKQWRDTYIVDQTKVTNIRVKINNSVPSAWKTATRFAFAQWNAIANCVVNIIEVSSGQNLTISYGALSPSSTIARASFPNSAGDVGPTITISTNHNSLSTSKKNFTMVHELGHCLGMRHINNSESGRIQISGTPTTDNNSVMNPTVKDWGGFSSADNVAAQVVYPSFSGAYIIVYQHSNYSGNMLLIRNGQSVNSSELSSAGLHDKISSIRTYSGARVTVYKNSNYSSDNMLVQSDLSSMGTYDFNDKISSINWNVPTGKYAILYKDNNYTGRPVTITGNVSSLGSSFGFNDKATSLRLYNGATIRLYKDSGYSGSSLYRTIDTSSLGGSYNFNDKTSSVILY
jgi:hypothetical protein